MTRYSSLIRNRDALRTEPEAPDTGSFHAPGGFWMYFCLPPLWGYLMLMTLAIQEANSALEVPHRTARLHPMFQWALYPTGIPKLIAAINAANRDRQDWLDVTKQQLERFYDRSMKHSFHIFHNPSMAREPLEEAINTAGLLGKPPSIPSALLESIPSAASLPKGSTLSILRSDIGAGTLIDFQVKPPAGQSIPPISAVDIVLEGPNGPIPHFAVERTQTNIGSAAIVVLLDCSGSMNGLRFDQTRAALESFSRQAGPQTQLQLIAFESTVRALTPLTTDRNLFVGALPSRSTNGGTELAQGLEVSLRSLETSRLPVKAVVVCSDGEDDKLAAALPSLIGRATGSRTKIHVLAIDDPGLDQTNLKTLAEQTGGIWTLAAQPQAIASQLDQILATFTESSYRLTALNFQKSTQLQLQVGNLKAAISDTTSVR
jgi:uncharacterized protein YegL